MNWPVANHPEAIEHAAALLRAGGVVAFPTETYYGLAVDPFNPQALERLFRIKHRPRSLPILVLVEDVAQIARLSMQLTPMYRHLIARFWPGPLTLVCPALPILPPQLTGNTATIGVRQSPDPTATALLSAFGGPITATSANISGFPAAITAEEVARMFGDALDLIIDGGTTPGGAGSTLVRDTKGVLTLIRAGKIEFSEIQACVAQWSTPALQGERGGI